MKSYFTRVKFEETQDIYQTYINAINYYRLKFFFFVFYNNKKQIHMLENYISQPCHNSFSNLIICVCIVDK